MDGDQPDDEAKRERDGDHGAEANLLTSRPVRNGALLHGHLSIGSSPAASVLRLRRARPFARSVEDSIDV